jgi:F-type H+-transporting ATPase subunit b
MQTLLASNALIKVTPGLMIWTIVAFLITLFVLQRWAFGPIQKTIDERRDRIRQSLAEADNAREEARHLLEEHRKLIGQAREEAEAIRQEVRQDAEALRERAREEIETDRQRRLDETRRQIEAETARSIAQIRAEIAELTYLAASKVTGKALDSADQRRLIDEAIASLDFSVLEEKAPA